MKFLSDIAWTAVCYFLFAYFFVADQALLALFSVTVWAVMVEI